MPQNVSSRLDEAEGGLREAGKKRFETIQAAAKKERKNERVKESLCELWNTIKENNPCIIRDPQREQKKAESFLNK